MTVYEAVAAFDQISPVYDATREPLDAATLDAIADRLRERGVRSILEVGVGTGRIAGPLSERGFDVTGIDASRAMLGVARAKGLPRLVQGDAYRLPFPDRAFDTAIFVHVLHLLDLAPAALAEAERVGRFGAVALVHPPRTGPRETGPGMPNDARRVIFRYLAREGYPIREDARSGGPPTRERRLLEQIPPNELVIVSDREVTEPLAKRLEMFERRASRQTLRVPPEVMHRAAEAARAEIGDRTVTFRRVEALATWRSPRTPGAAAREPRPRTGAP